MPFILGVHSNALRDLITSKGNLSLLGAYYNDDANSPPSNGLNGLNGLNGNNGQDRHNGRDGLTNLTGSLNSSSGDMDTGTGMDMDTDPIDLTALSDVIFVDIDGGTQLTWEEVQRVLVPPPPPRALVFSP